MLSVAVLRLAFAAPQPPDAAELVRRSMRSVDESRKKTRQYAYRDYKVTVDRDTKGKETGRETEKLRKEEQIRKEENSGKRPRRIFSLSYSFFLPYQKLAAIYDLKRAGEEEVGGRHTYMVTATPKPDFRAATDDEKR
jgi:hypothetical protein